MMDNYVGADSSAKSEARRPQKSEGDEDWHNSQKKKVTIMMK